MHETMEAYNFWYTLSFFIIMALVLGILSQPIEMGKSFLAIIMAIFTVAMALVSLTFAALLMPFRALEWLGRKKKKAGASKPEPTKYVFVGSGVRELEHKKPRLVNGEARRLEKKGED
ncbi:hypothetical protein [Thioalkalivibrio sp. ALE19]|uniref:hypothetical protein n=1 Tax=Thioalkalivibrio sp. ALE19 TaxID=1266909 RepID=UPI00048ADF25|nr:hypothetical protein [Thioalkalivibrio sp. ALE19]